MKENEIIITPLGTVSPYCKKEMNCPGFLIEWGDNKFLLDCGNGISRLLNFPHDLEKLKIFISHYHKDHYGELGIIQYASYVYHNLGLLEHPIEIYLPEDDFGFAKEEILNNKETYSKYFCISNDDKYNFNGIDISFLNNNSHTIDSYMMKLENDNFKIVYTSDVGNSKKDGIVNFCMNADLLICESSFLRVHNSKIKTHLTAYEAGEIAKLSNVKKLLLTHFWPEEDKDLYLDEAKSVFGNAMIAEEGKKLVLKK